jgi:hypothetical protein
MEGNIIDYFTVGRQRRTIGLTEGFKGIAARRSIEESMYVYVDNIYTMMIIEEICTCIYRGKHYDSIANLPPWISTGIPSLWASREEFDARGTDTLNINCKNTLGS